MSQPQMQKSCINKDSRDSDHRPTVTLALPVYNGANYIEDALESIQNQTFQDFELIISDNASTDETEKICRHFARSDQRIRYIRQPSNIGAAANFNFLFYQSRGDFFKWCASDDVIEATYLEKCIAQLQRRPDAVLCQSYTTVIDQWKNKLEDFSLEYARNCNDPIERLRDCTLYGLRCYEVFGVFRRKTLAQTGLIGNHIAGDNLLLMHIALLGPFTTVQEGLFLYRRHSAQSVAYVGDSQSYHQWFKGNEIQAIGVSLPDWVFIIECWKLSVKSNLSLINKFRFMFVMGEFTYRCRRKLAQNLRIIMENLIFGNADPRRRRRCFSR